MHEFTTYIRFQEHLFDNEWPEELSEVFTPTHMKTDIVRGAWFMDKPVSRLIIDPNNIEEQRAISECFNVAVEIYDKPYNFAHGAIYFSRFPELAEMAKEMESHAVGVLFGLDNRDVASYVVREDGEITTPRKS